MQFKIARPKFHEFDLFLKRDLELDVAKLCGMGDNIFERCKAPRGGLRFTAAGLNTVSGGFALTICGAGAMIF